MGRGRSKEQPQQPEQPIALVPVELPTRNLMAALNEQLLKADPRRGEILERTLSGELELETERKRRIEHGFRLVKAADGSRLLEYSKKTASGQEEKLTLCEGKKHLKPSELHPYWKKFLVSKELKSPEDFKEMLYCLHTAIYGHEVRDGKLITKDKNLNAAFEMLQDKTVLLDDQWNCAVSFLTTKQINFHSRIVEETVDDYILQETRISLFSDSRPEWSVKIDYELYGNTPPPETRRYSGGLGDMGWNLC
jgi:hypothetical protein